jgi:hypothetical protein
MAERSPQTLANHVKIDPPFHYFVLPVFAITWIVSVIFLVRHPGFLHFWIVIFNSAIIVAVIRARQYALKVQDRVIRLEERLRLSALLPDSLRSQIAKLSEDQLIAALCLRRRVACAGRTDSSDESHARRYQEGHTTLAAGLLASLKEFSEPSN